VKTLILFSTRDGQTREIASYLASELKEQGIDADTIDLNRTNEVEWRLYDRVVIGASIRYGHFHPALERFVKTHLQSLQALPGAFFSVNLVARKPEKRTPQTNSYTRKFLLNSPWQPQMPEPGKVFFLPRRGSRSTPRCLPARSAIHAIVGTIGL